MTRTVRDTPERSSAIRTFLIADIRGYTRFTNELGDEAGSRLAAKFAQVTAEGVEAYGGTLLELRGDEALCVFESARAALRCAVELQDAYSDETRIEPHLPLTVGIGLDAGEAVPTGDGYRGAALNLAARLCSAAEAGAVLATDGLVHLAGKLDGLAYAALDGRPVKGFDEPVAAWLIASVGVHEHDVVDPAAAEPGQLPPELDAMVPLVGREADLRWLRWYWRRARHGHGSVVALSGPRGIGRTRLAAEMAALAHSEGAHVRYIRSDFELTGVGRPALLVADDAETIPAARAREMWRALAVGSERQLVVVTHVEPAPASLSSQLARFVPDERRRSLGPLPPDAVAEIARLYLERPGDEPPSQLLFEESDGVPAAIHRVASQWARAAAVRHLGESARRTSRERRDLRAAEEELIGDVTNLERARDRSRLYVDVAADVEVGQVTVCPYKGLAAFEAVDAEYYFGRERLVADLIARIVGSAFVGLVGASGSGKSSALQAALLPELAHGVLPSSDQWTQVLMRPGDHPVRELQSALRRAAPDPVGGTGDLRASLDALLRELSPAQRALLVIDQFEEIFANTDESERSEFIDVITQPRAGLKVLVSVRADHYERCAAYPLLARALGGGQVLIGPLSTAEIEAIIRHPAERVGLRVEPELVEALVADIGAEPGALPLLSTALLELWEARDGARLTLAAYHATGGVRGAVARMAESAYQRLDEERQAAARGIFLRLAGAGDAESVVRRRVRADELGGAEGAPVADALRDLTAARLLTASEGYIEVAHEALLREWPRLRAWLDEDAAGRQLRLHLIGAARTWHEGGREEGDLYRGARLAAVMDWSEQHGVELNAVERAFVGESRAASTRAAERQKTINRRLRALLAAAGVLVVVAAGAGGVAFLQAGRAEAEASTALREAERAEEQSQLAEARSLAASALNTLDADPQLSMQLALDAVEKGGEDVPEAVVALHQAVQRARSLVHIELPDPPGEPPARIGLALAADGQTAFVATDSYAITAYDTSSGEVVSTLGEPRPNPGNMYLGVAQSSDGLLATVDAGGVVHLWDPETATERTLDNPGFGTPGAPVFSDDGSRLAVLTYTSDARNPQELTLTVWDVERELMIRSWGEEAIADFVSIDFHPDGTKLLVPTCGCSFPAEVRWFDVDTGEVTTIVDSHALSAAVLSPDARFVATASSDRTAKIWDAGTGELIRTFRGHDDVVMDVEFSMDGSWLATTSSDGTVRVWDVESEGDPSGVELMTLAGQGGLPTSSSFSEDRDRLATVSNNMTLRVWDVTRVRTAEVDGFDLGFGRVMNIDVAGKTAMVYGRPCSDGFCLGSIGLIDLDTGRTRFLPNGSGLSARLTPDGSAVFSQRGSPGGDATRWGQIERYSVDSLEATGELDGICPYSFAGDPGCAPPPAVPFDEQAGRFAFSADGRVMAMVGNSGAVSLWDPDSGELRALVPSTWLGERVVFDLFGIDLSPDGSLLAVATFDHGIKLLETAVLIDHWPTLRDEELDPDEISSLLGRVRTIDAARDVWRLQFTPDGSTLALASPNGSQLIEVATGEIRHELRESWDLDLSSDATEVVTMDIDGTARLWEVASGRLVREIPVITYGLGPLEGGIRFTADDQHILVVDNGMVLMMTVETQALVDIARGRVTRPLTQAECDTYGVTGCG